MTYKDIGFRGIYHRFWAIDINDVIRKSCREFPDFEKANCVLVYGYIDHDEGTTMEVVACGHKDNDVFNFFEAPDDRRSFIRIGAIENDTFYDLNDIFDELKERYKDKIKVPNSYKASPELMETRRIAVLDASRHEHYPDDIQLYLKTKEENIEVCWVRIEGVADKTFFGRLLNEPYKDSRCHEGDIIEFNIYETEEGKFVCVSEGKTLKPIHTEENILKSAISTFKQNMTENNLIEILEILRDVLVWIPCNAVVSEADIESLKNKKVRDTFQSTDNIRMIPDILQSGDEYFFPVFTSCDEMGEYGENFSKIEKWFLETIPIAQNNEKQVKGIVINAFTDSFVVPNDLLEIVKKRGSRISKSED